MDGRRIRSFVVFVTFLGFAASCSGGNRKIAQVFVSNAVPINLIDEDAAEQIWTCCKRELKELTQGIKNFEWHEKINSNYDTDSIESAVAWFARKRLQKTISNLPHHVKQTLLDCVKKKTKPSQDSVGEYLSSNWLIKYRLLLSNRSTLSRRYLLRNSRHKLTSSSVDASDNARKPLTAAMRAADVAEGPTQKMMAKSPAAAEVDPASPTSPVTPDSPPPPRTLPDYLLLPFLPGVDVPPAMTQGNSGGNTGGNAGGHSASHMVLVYTVIGVGCLAFLLLVALIWVCFFKIKYKKELEQRNARRDDKPISDVGSSDTSTGSTHINDTPGDGAKKKSNRPPVSPGNIAIGKSKTKMVQKSTNSESQSPESSTAGLPEGGDSIIEGSELPPPPRKVAPPPPPGKVAPPPLPSDAEPMPSAPPPPPPKVPAGPRPPPPPKAGTSARPTPMPTPHFRNPNGADAPKTKLKPFFWDKVLANPDHSMVWHQIKGGSFQVDEEMIESLFGVSAAERNKLDHKKETTPFELPNQHVQIIDPKKAQNLSILLKALNVTTEEVCNAIKEGHELPPELVQTLLRMAPTSEEELKLRLYSDDLNQLGPAERFLKVLVDIPFAFKRLESLLFMSFLQEELSSLKESFATLEVACKELTKSRLFLKLLEAVLKTGNRMNDGTFRGGAQAFKLDTLLKLSDVKGTDGKTTLLHFVVQEIIRSEGVRAARRAKEAREAPPEDSTEEEVADYYRGLGLKVVSGLSSELVNVKKAALIDGDVLTSTVSKLGHSLAKSREFLNREMQTVVESTNFRETLTSFIQNAEVDVMWLLEEEKRMMAQVRTTADYFHGQAGKDEGLRLFVIVRDFLIILDKVCREVRSTSLAAAARTSTRGTSLEASPSSSTVGESHRRSNSEAHKLLFPTIKEPEENDDLTSSDEDTPEE